MISCWKKKLLLTGMIYMHACRICHGIDPPGKPNREVSQSTSIRVSWLDVDGADSYKVKAVLTGTPFSNCNGAQVDDAHSPYTISSLSPRTLYDIAVCSNQGGSTSTPSTKLTNIPTGPKAPEDIQISTSTATSLDISWADNDVQIGSNFPVMRYDVTYKLTEDGPGSIKSTPKQNSPPTSLVINDLTSNTNYIITVTSVTSSETVISDESLPETGTTLISQPTNIQKSGASSSSTATISWVPPDLGGKAEGLQTYEVTCNPNDCNSFITETIATISDLVSNTRYFITVNAVATSGALGMPSSALLVTTLISQPTSVKLTGTTTSSTASIRWMASDLGGEAEDIQSYEVVCIPSGCNSTISGTTAIVYDLASNTNHVITVTPMTNQELGEPSDPLSVTTLISQPISVSLTGATTSSTASISWMAPDVGGGAEGIQSYEVVCIPSGCTSTISGTTAIVSDLASNANNVITVISVTTSGKLGAPSSSFNITTLPGKPILTTDAKPQTSNNTITFEWNKPDGGDLISNYSVQYKASETTRSGYITAKVIDHIVGISTYNCTIKDLIPGQKYDLQVVPFNTEGMGTPLQEVRNTGLYLKR